MDKFIVAILGIAGIIFTAWFFFGKNGPDQHEHDH